MKVKPKKTIPIYPGRNKKTHPPYGRSVPHLSRNGKVVNATHKILREETTSGREESPSSKEARKFIFEKREAARNKKKRERERSEKRGKGGVNSPRVKGEERHVNLQIKETKKGGPALVQAANQRTCAYESEGSRKTSKP